MPKRCEWANLGRQWYDRKEEMAAMLSEVKRDVEELMTTLADMRGRL